MRTLRNIVCLIAGGLLVVGGSLLIYQLNLTWGFGLIFAACFMGILAGYDDQENNEKNL